mgnify:FL=1
MVACTRERDVGESTLFAERLLIECARRAAGTRIAGQDVVGATELGGKG